MRSFALATVFAMAAALKIKSQEGSATGAPGDWQDPAAGGLDCATAYFDTIINKFSHGWVSYADLSMFTDIKCTTDCGDVDWNSIDWDFMNALRDGWKGAFWNTEWNYLERSVEEARFTAYVERIAEEKGKGEADLVWLE
jgi:hypothetical protein